MNILTDSLPQTVNVCGKEIPIKTDFKTWIRFTQIAFNDMSAPFKSFEAIRLVFTELPPNLFEALVAVMDFYNPTKTVASAEEKKQTTKVYDFDYDANLIYSAFMQQYGIDLQNADMHWYVFKALLDGLTDCTSFIKTLQFRCVDLSTIKSDDMRKYYADMKRCHSLPDNRSQGQKEADFSSAFKRTFVKGR